MINCHPRIYVLNVLLIIILINSIAIGGISSGDRVRIDVDTTIHKKFLLFIPYSETEKREIIGQVVSITRDSISIIDDTWKAEVRHVLTSGVKRIYVSEGLKRNTVKGILNGAIFGGMLFGIVAMSPHHPDNLEPVPDFYDRLKIVTVGTAGSALLGGIIGWFSKVDRWRKLEADEWRVNLDVGARKKNLAINISYFF